MYLTDPASPIIIVYRVETPKGGRGPYSLPEGLGLQLAHSDGHHPSPVQEGLKRMLPTDCCGFATLKALHSWFRGWHRYLHWNGFKIALYKVPADRVRLAAMQVVFRRGDLLPVETRPLVEED